MNESQDERVVRSFISRMVDAWNRGHAKDFAAPFSGTADFIAFDGTHLVGRQAITEFHQPLFDSAMKGAHIEGEVKFVHFPKVDVAVMHAMGMTILPGQNRPSPSRDSMQLFVAMKRNGQWLVDAMLNARCFTLEQQRFADNFELLTTQARREVIERVTLHH